MPKKFPASLNFAKRTSLLAVLLLLPLLAWTVVARIGTPSLRPLENLNELSNSEPGIAARLIVNGNGIATITKGLANTSPDVRITSLTNFNIASVSKQFTAYAILILERDGKLNRDQTLSSIIPELPAWAKTITLNHLLSHSSGVPEERWSCFLPFSTNNSRVVEYLAGEPDLVTAPGAVFSYSNTGYELLATVVERASGQEFRQFLNSRIFEPLEMKNTSVYSSDHQEFSTNRAVGFNSWPLAFGFSPLECFDIVGDSGIYTNLEDYTKWLKELHEPKLVKPDVFYSGLKRGISIRDGLTYSLGWSVSSLEGHLQIEHRGTVNGFRIYVLGLPKEDSWLVFFSNNADVDRVNIVGNILESHAREVKFDPQTISGF